MIIEQQQNLIVRVLTPLLSNESDKLTVPEKTALKAALQMVLCNPTMAADYAAALQMLIDFEKRSKEKGETDGESTNS